MSPKGHGEILRLSATESVGVPDEISIDTHKHSGSRQAVKRPRIVLDDFFVLRGADAAAIF